MSTAPATAFVSEPYSWAPCPSCGQPNDPWGDHRRDAHAGVVQVPADPWAVARTHAAEILRDEPMTDAQRHAEDEAERALHERETEALRAQRWNI